jgi:hypothetical protein
MSHEPEGNPVRTEQSSIPSTLAQIPSSSELQTRIGRLLRELRVACRLFTLAKLAETYRALEQAEVPERGPTAPTALGGG